jgi:hypothetical protein
MVVRLRALYTISHITQSPCCGTRARTQSSDMRRLHFVNYSDITSEVVCLTIILAFVSRIVGRTNALLP